MKELQTLNKGQKVVMFVAGVAPCGGVDTIKSCTARYIRTVNGVVRENGDIDKFVPASAAGAVYLSHTHKLGAQETAEILNGSVEEGAKILFNAFKQRGDWRVKCGMELARSIVAQALDWQAA